MLSKLMRPSMVHSVGTRMAKGLVTRQSLLGKPRNCERRTSAERTILRII